MDHVSSYNPYDIRFIDECGFNINSRIRYYGSSESGSRALHINKHNIGPNYTLFLMLGLDNKIFAHVSEGASDSFTCIDFIHQAVNSRDINGFPVLYLGCCIVADRARIHSRQALDILEPYFEELDIRHFYLPAYLPMLNSCEEAFGYLQALMRTTHFQNLLQFYVPTAIYESVTYLTPDIVYKLFRNASCNYMNL